MNVTILVCDRISFFFLPTDWFAFAFSTSKKNNFRIHFHLLKKTKRKISYRFRYNALQFMWIVFGKLYAYLEARSHSCASSYARFEWQTMAESISMRSDNLFRFKSHLQWMKITQSSSNVLYERWELRSLECYTNVLSIYVLQSRANEQFGL